MTENTGTLPTPPPVPNYPPSTRPPLRRSRTDRVLGGVAAGVARWLGIDPVIVRVVLVVLALFGGSGLLLYVVGWLFIPDEGAPKSEAEKLLDSTREPNSTGRTILLICAVAIGLLVLVGIASSGPWGGAWGGGGWLLMLAVIGLVLWLVSRPATGTAAWTPPPTSPVTTPAPVDGTLAAAASEAAPAVDPPVPFEDTTAYATAGYAYGGHGGYPGYVAPIPSPTPPRPPQPRSYLGLAALSLSVMTMGVLGALNMAGAATIPMVVVFAAGLGVLGLGLLVGAFLGRARWLIAIALPLLLVTAMVALIPADLGDRLGHGVGERVWTPTTVAEATVPYRLSVGSARLDLTLLALPSDPGAVIPVQATVGIGELIVTVPQGVNVHVEAKAGLGEVIVRGLPKQDGQNATIVDDVPGFVDDSAPTIDLIVSVAIGNLEVSRA